jgi:Glycosyl transferase family 2
MSDNQETFALSIVVAVPDGGPILGSCLAALEAQISGIAAEILVIDGTKSETAAGCLPDSGSVRILRLPSQPEVPALWQAGIEASRGRIIALLVDSCIPGPDWVRQILRAHQADCAVIGGAIALAPTLGTVDSAIYFCRYSSYMPPFSANFRDDLPGNNCSYKRAALTGVRDELADGFWETFVHRKMRARGDRLLCLPEILVYYVGSASCLSFLRVRFNHGCRFAARRAKELNRWQRIPRTLAFPIVPFVMLSRIARRVWGNRRYRTKFPSCVPLLMIFLTAWSMGECVGYVLGPSQGRFQTKKSEDPVLREAG